MQKYFQVVMGIILWAIAAAALLYQIGTGGLSVSSQFLIDLAVLVCSLVNQIVLLTKLVLQRKQMRRREIVVGVLFSALNSLFLLLVLWGIVIMALIF